MGEIQNPRFCLSFNPSMKVDSQGTRVASDAGLLVVRELCERLGLSQFITEDLTDVRRDRNTQLLCRNRLRQSNYSRRSARYGVGRRHTA
jgi:hypothetical protein